jgi:hypothetical protein
VACPLTTPAVAAVSPPGLRYEIQVRLDSARHRLDGRATIHYRSGADTTLRAIWLHAYPNALSGPHTVYGREAERVGEDYRLRFAPDSDRGWMTIDSVTVDGILAPIALQETLARIDLHRPLAPGDSVALTMRFSVQVPSGHERFDRRGDRYSVAQWYPKVVVYDERGWALDPFHYVSEFYGDYGTYDVSITLPDPFWVGATGLLRSAAGGDNEIPLMESRTPRDSVTVTLRTVGADTLADRWPEGRDGLQAVTDLAPPRRARGEVAHTVTRDHGVAIRVPRGAPVHYFYRWSAKEDVPREEADAEGRPSPWRLLRASCDTVVVDTLRALAAEAAHTDTVLPSLKTLRYHAARVHDFAWVAAPSYVRADTTWAEIAVRALVYREDEPNWHPVLGWTVDALRHYTRIVGPYEWPSFTSAEAFCGGSAMEYPMLVMNEPAMYSRYFHELDDTNAHELGHNWFYGMLGSDERAHPWLDEGFTQHIEADYTDTKYPDGIFARARSFPWLRGYHMRDLNELDYLERAWLRDEQPLTTPADSATGYDTYSVAAYTKPASMLHTLRGVMGDSIFGEFLHDYYRRGLFRHPRPADVVAAANEASGADYSKFFHDWVETTARPSFALGKIRREGNRATVIVQRKEDMSFPIRVQATFADGTVQEKVVDPIERETPVHFESAARLKRAVIDPRHEIVEMDRLDNASGLLPPMRFRPLAGFPGSEAIGVDYGPTIWHGEAEGMRLGAWLEGKYLPSLELPHGIKGFEGGLSFGAADGSVAYRVGAWSRVEELGARSRARVLVARDAGLTRARISLENVVKASGGLHPFRSWAVTLEARDRDDLEPVDPRYWSLGQTLDVGADLGLETIGPRRLERISLGYRHGEPVGNDKVSESGYDWLRFEARQDLDLLPRGELRVSWRAAAGTVFRDPPLEAQFDVAEESRLDALPLFYANDRGPLRETDHFLVPGGGGARGYFGRAILGQSLLAASVEISHSAYPIVLFADVSRAEASAWGEEAGPGLDPLVGRTLGDAGFAYGLGPVSLAFPVWVGSPASDENPWRFRWQFSIALTRVPGIPYR